MLLPNDSEATGRIKIIKVPDGEAPIELRQALVGLTLPCTPFVGPIGKEHLFDAVTKEMGSRNRSGFTVPQGEALKILEASNPIAAGRWRAHGLPIDGGYFFFSVDEAKIISGVVRQQVAPEQ